jgi:hypothetical protein
MFIVYCQHGEVWQFCYCQYVEFECAFYVQNEMLCTKHITVFSLGNSFPIVLSGQVHYTSQHNTIGKQFPQEKTIIERCY